MPPKKDKDLMQEDFTPKVEATVPEQIKLAKSGKIDEAIENLLSLEKQTRQAEDYHSTTKLAKTIIQICFEANDFKRLNDNLQLLAKRRGQLRTVVQDIVKEAISYIDKIPNKDTKLELISSLRSITEGKIYVEIERARLTRILAKMKEDEGNIPEAADIMQELQVETFGQMDRSEKTDFILEQMRLCLTKKDYIRTQILGNKISKKLLNDKEFEDLKIRYFTLMIAFYSHESKYLEICRAYQSIFNTPKIQANEAEWKKYLQLMVVYICLAPHDHEQHDLANRINEEKQLALIPEYKNLLTAFLTNELMRWPQLQSVYSGELKKHNVFSDVGSDAIWADLRKRVVEHNIRVVADYYSRITYKRLSQLLDLSADEAEKFVSNLVVAKVIFAKIDRPNGIINFKRKKDPNELLNEWSTNISELLNLVESTCHLIARENMVHKINA